MEWGGFGECCILSYIQLLHLWNGVVMSSCGMNSKWSETKLTFKWCRDFFVWFDKNIFNQGGCEQTLLLISQMTRIRTVHTKGHTVLVSWLKTVLYLHYIKKSAIWLSLTFVTISAQKLLAASTAKYNLCIVELHRNSWDTGGAFCLPTY